MSGQGSCWLRPALGDGPVKAEGKKTSVPWSLVVGLLVSGGFCESIVGVDQPPSLAKTKARLDGLQQGAEPVDLVERDFEVQS